MSCSFQTQSMLLLHMAARIRRDLPICFLETGYHFWGTLIFREQIASQWKLDMLETAFIATPQKMYQAERFIARFYRDQADHDQEKKFHNPTMAYQTGQPKKAFLCNFFILAGGCHSG